MDTSQYLDMFLDESREHLQSCTEKLLELEQAPEDIAIVNEIFRAAHTLKGMSATMGYEDIADLTHKMENVLDAIRNEEITVTTELLDVVFEAVDYLEEMVYDIEDGGDGRKDVQKLVQALQNMEQGKPANEGAEKEESVSAENSTVANTTLTYDEFESTVIEQSLDQGFHAYEIEVKLRDDCILKTARVYMLFEKFEDLGEVVKSAPPAEQLENEEFDTTFTVVLLTKATSEEIHHQAINVSEVETVTITEITEGHFAQAKQAKKEAKEQQVEEAVQEVEETKAPAPAKKKAKKKEPKKQRRSRGSQTIRVNIERLDILMNLFEELVIDRGRLQSIASELNNAELTETVERMTRVSGDLQNIILNMRMVPVETVFNRFPKMVRQLARDLDKKINLEIVGAETELDRTVIDEIGDPLVHLIRNALDHGVETPEKRLAAGKPETGTVTLRAYHSGNHVFIELEDDGAGINREKVLAKALENGIVTEEVAETLTDRQVAELILASGFSTAQSITGVSGRGVGLDVVKSTIESLGGYISIDSVEGKGSLFQIQLPLTLSIISVMLVKLKEELYAIPLSSIIETAIIKSSDVFNAHNQRVIDFRGRIVPLVYLKEIFDVPDRNEEGEFQSIVIVRKGEKLAGLVVDSFIGQQEIVLKSLGNYLQNVFAISGATILGNGQVALIVECNSLIQ